MAEIVLGNFNSHVTFSRVYDEATGFPELHVATTRETAFYCRLFVAVPYSLPFSPGRTLS